MKCQHRDEHGFSGITTFFACYIAAYCVTLGAIFQITKTWAACLREDSGLCSIRRSMKCRLEKDKAHIDSNDISHCRKGSYTCTNLAQEGRTGDLLGLRQALVTS